MFSWFQQAKELVSSPTIQMGQPVPPVNSESGGIAKKKKVDEEGEMTEEGFVCVGRSSFYSSSSVEQPVYPSSSYNSNRIPPYPPLPYQNQQFQTAVLHQMYPDLPTPIPNMNYQKNSESSSMDQVNELIRHIPFVLHPDLRPCTSIYDPLSATRSSNRMTAIDWSFFDYDFDYERSVVREVNLHYRNA